jgi:hypothetical protein
MAFFRPAGEQHPNLSFSKNYNGPGEKKEPRFEARST